jgi:hypothetical protein
MVSTGTSFPRFSCALKSREMGVMGGVFVWLKGIKKTLACLNVFGS